MRKNFGAKPWVYPQPVLMIGTYDESGKPNLMNAAWGGQYGANTVMLCLSRHKTTDNIKATGAFTLLLFFIDYPSCLDNAVEVVLLLGLFLD